MYGYEKPRITCVTCGPNKSQKFEEQRHRILWWTSSPKVDRLGGALPNNILLQFFIPGKFQTQKENYCFFLVNWSNLTVHRNLTLFVTPSSSNPEQQCDAVFTKAASLIR